MNERKICSAGLSPGQCLNATCENSRYDYEYDTATFGNSEIVQEAEFRRRCIERAKMERDRVEKIEFLKSERRKMGMESLMPADNDTGTTVVAPQSFGGRPCPRFDLHDLKTADEARTMREPARPSCMLQPPNFTPPSNDYHELSRFLRVSTMAGYNLNDDVSEYRDNHNMAVWNNRKDMDPQLFKMKRDWLSVWGEFNVKEQCWRKAWTEKFGTR